MTGSEGARLTLTALFAVLGAWYLAAAAISVRSTGTGRGGQALGCTLHVLMSAAMISMLWSWGADVPVIAQVTLFTAAAGWFAGQAVFGTAGGRYVNWYHAGMMAVMVWLPVAMELTSAPAADGEMAGMSGMAMPGGGMAGMAMGGQAPPAAGGAVTGLPAGSPGWTGTACLVLAAAFFAAAAWQAVSALRPLAVPDHGSADAPRHSIASAVLRDGTGALMAASMAVALLEMT